jgi:hypothetical protein
MISYFYHSVLFVIRKRADQQLRISKKKTNGISPIKPQTLQPIASHIKK